MGLDIYVGPLCRYCNGDWTPIMGWPANAGDSVGRDEPLPDTYDMVPKILEWREAVQRQLAGHITGSLDWSEEPTQRYYPDKPGSEAYGALLFWASYASLPGRRPPSQFEPNKWLTDVSLDDLRPPPEDDLVGHLWYRMWLPCGVAGSHSVAFPWEDEPISVGGVDELVASLDEINARTWNAGPQQIQDWSRRGPPATSDWNRLHPWAEFGFSVFHTLARTALRERLPMVLDW